MTHLINLIITTGIYPKDWKRAKIIPLYKGKEARKAAPKSYRPIALLPIISKVMERAIHNHIMEHMEANQFWHPNHHAYRKNRNTETAVIQMYDTWIQAALEGKMGAATMIDMSAAFDTVDIDILLGKCKLYNFGDGAMKLLESYLRDREQLVSIRGSELDVRKIEAGVPQGSIL